jgi:Bacteriocin-protection, YdeI or OmpD-Associated/Domain of unknown function (DUF1905)
VTRRIDMTARVLIVGVNPYVVVSAERVTMLRPGWRKPLPVLVRINEGPTTPWRTNLTPTGDGSFRLYLHGAMRTTAKVEVGDEVRVRLEVDNAYYSNPAHAVPQWFQAALDADSVSSENWMKLSPSQRKEVVRYLGTLKSPEARDRNLRRALSALRGEPGRFLGRDWVDGR